MAHLQRSRSLKELVVLALIRASLVTGAFGAYLVVVRVAEQASGSVG